VIKCCVKDKTRKIENIVKNVIHICAFSTTNRERKMMKA